MARRHPLWLGMQFFLVFLGVGALGSYLWELVGFGPAHALATRDVAVGAITAVLVTLMMRQMPVERVSNSPRP